MVSSWWMTFAALSFLDTHSFNGWPGSHAYLLLDISRLSAVREREMPLKGKSPFFTLCIPIHPRMRRTLILGNHLEIWIHRTEPLFCLVESEGKGNAQILWLHAEWGWGLSSDTVRTKRNHTLVWGQKKMEAKRGQTVDLRGKTFF